MIKKNEIKFSSNERGGFNGESFYTHVIFFFLSLSSSFLDNKNKKKMAPRSSGEGAAVFFFLFLMDLKQVRRVTPPHGCSVLTLIWSSETVGECFISISEIKMKNTEE